MIMQQKEKFPSKLEMKSSNEELRIQQLELELAKLENQVSLKEDAYKQLDSKLANYEKIEEMIKAAQVEDWKLRYQKLEAEIMELRKRPTLEEFDSKNKLIQQLAVQLKKMKEFSVTKEEYFQLEFEKNQLQESYNSIVNTVEQLESTIANYKNEDDERTHQIVQFEEKLKKYEDIDANYKIIKSEQVDLQNKYNHQLEQFNELSRKYSAIEEQLEKEKKSKENTQTETQLETPNGIREYDNISPEEQVTNIDQLFIEDRTQDTIFDPFIEEILDESEILEEQDIDEEQIVQNMTEVLSTTVPTKEIEIVTNEAVKENITFLPRGADAEHLYLKKVLREIDSNMRSVPSVEFQNYEVDFSTGYAEGIMRKQVYEHNNKLKNVKDRPYIGRVDYLSDQQGETLYIGEQGVNDFVISWKAEAASLYFLRTVGQSVNHETLGKVVVDYVRQIDITSGEIKTLHPPLTTTSQFFKDEGLVSSLNNKRGVDMQSIVATLQREQYEIIRLPMNQSIIIQGSAGSGKSAIALHRLSYLLYKYKNLKPKNVAIIGPNKAFLKHIQNVLPTLGDFGIQQTTFLEIACAMLMISPSKINRHSNEELTIIKCKGSLEFRRIVEETTLSAINDLRIWAKPYIIKDLTIPIVPILREMEKYQRLTLKERENLYFNLFLKSLQKEIETKKIEQNTLKQWVEDKAENVIKYEVTLDNEKLTNNSKELRGRFEKYLALYQVDRSKETKKLVDKSRNELLLEIEDSLKMILDEYEINFKQIVPSLLEEGFIIQVWQSHIKCQLELEREKIILKNIQEQELEVLTVSSVIETPEIEKELKEVHNITLKGLVEAREAFFNELSTLLEKALLAEVISLLELQYNKQIKKWLKSQYDLEYYPKNKQQRYKYDEYDLSPGDSDEIKKYVVKHLELDYIDCFDEAIRVAKTEGIIPNDYRSLDIYYEDIPALLHINRILKGLSKEHTLSYLIVDEAQDYMPYAILEMHAITKKNGLMLIGDLGQNLNPASSLQSWNAIEGLISNPAYYELKATYRSTSQILDVGNKIIGPYADGKYALSTDTFREGNEVKWIKYNEESEEQKIIEILEEAIYTNNYETVAVIVKEESLLPYYQAMIDPYFSVAIQTESDLPKNVKVVITTPIAVKGLEFEGVVIARLHDYNDTDYDRKLAYVASSRALHQLYITVESDKKSILSIE